MAKGGKCFQSQAVTVAELGARVLLPARCTTRSPWEGLPFESTRAVSRPSDFADLPVSTASEDASTVRMVLTYPLRDSHMDLDEDDIKAWTASIALRTLERAKQVEMSCWQLLVSRKDGKGHLRICEVSLPHILAGRRPSEANFPTSARTGWQVFSVSSVGQGR